MAVNAKLVKELREKTGAGILDCKKALSETDGDLNKAADYLREKGISKAEQKASTRIAAEGLCNVKVTGNRAVIFELNAETDFVAKNDTFKALLQDIAKVVLDSEASNLDEANELELNGMLLDKAVKDASATIGEKLTLRRLNVVVKEDSQSFGAYVHMGGKIASLVTVEGDNEEAARDIAMHVAAINPRFLNQDEISDEVIEHERSVLRKEALNEGKPEHIVDKMVEGRLNKFLKEICLVNQPFVKNPDLTVEDFAKEKGVSIIRFDRLEVGEGIEKRSDDFAGEVKAQMKG
ncbi:MAG: translation elongation factor Ts [Bacillota bacterium]